MALKNCPECNKQISDQSSFCINCGAPVNNLPNTNSIISNPYEIKGMLIANHDFPHEMNWDDAKTKCKELGYGWRLPTVNELTIIYEYKSKIGGLIGDFYWSSSDGGGGGYASFLDFSSGKENSIVRKETLHYVRAVKII